MTTKCKTSHLSAARPVNETAVIRKLSFVSVFGNTVLSGIKLFAGITGNSGAMISDAVHSFPMC